MLDCCQSHALPANWGGKELSTHVTIFQVGLKETHGFFQILWQAMRLGFTVWPTNQASLRRRPHHLHAQKKARHIHWNVTGTLPPSIYSIVHYEFDKEKVSTNITTLTPYCICDETCTGIHLRSGIQGTGFSTVTTHPHTLLWLCVHFLLKTKQVSCYTSLLTRVSALWQHTHTHTHTHTALTVRALFTKNKTTVISHLPANQI